MNRGVIFDLDQTLVDTSSLATLRDSRKWSEIYPLIPGLKSFAGIDSIFEYLELNKISIVVITTSPGTYCNRIITHCGWKVKGQICYHDVSRRKPDPESFFKAVKDYDLDVSKTISAGDRDIDILASNASNLPAIACTWASPDKHKLLSAKPSFVANNPTELFNLIKVFFS